MSKKIFSLFLLFSIHVSAASVETVGPKEPKGKLTIQLFNPERDLADLRELTREHLKTYARDLRGSFEEFMTSYVNATCLGLRSSTDEIFGEHGLFYQAEGADRPKMVGYIVVDYLKTELTAPNHAECTMLLHPEFRGKGLGVAFRKLFLAQVVDPKIGKEIRVGRYRVDSPVILPAREIFLGVKSFVDILNLPSRIVLLRSGYSVHDLHADAAGKEVQIVYLYPPAPSLLAPESISMIQENTLEKRARITEIAIMREREHNYFKDLSNAAAYAWANGGEKRIFEVYKNMKRTASATGNSFSEERFWVFINLCELTPNDRKWVEKVVTENAGDFAIGLRALKTEVARGGSGAGASAAASS